MTPPPPSPLEKERVLALLQQVAPGSRLLKVEPLPGSLSNYTHLVRARTPAGGRLDLVLRRYAIFGDYDRGEKARREFRTIELVHRYGIPVPEPILLDDAGEILGSPGIVTSFVPGSLRLEPPADPLQWVGEKARMLARIHAVPCNASDQRFLLEAGAEASWFLRSPSVPDYMMSFPGGDQLWQAVRDQFGHRRVIQPGLVHIDYWPGNILWLGDTLSAVLDWDEAAWGDPAIDVGYACMNLALSGSPLLATEFERAHVSEAGRGLENLGLWELAAAVRPMYAPDDWEVTSGPRREGLEGFIVAAAKRAREGS